MNRFISGIFLAASAIAAGAGSSAEANSVFSASSAPIPAVLGSDNNLPAGPTYADLADLADHAPSVIHALIRKVAPVEPARAPEVRSGWARMYVEAKPLGLLAGPPLPADSLRYLVDVPLDAKGRPPKLPRLAKRGVILFSRTIPERPGELQLVAPDAQILWDEAIESRLKGILAEMLAPGAPTRITGVREAIFVPGTLAGEGETQLFFDTANGEPASVTVIHQPGKAIRWSVSFSEVLEAGAEPPARDSLAWYRLACFLPRRLGDAVNVSATEGDRAQAAADYRTVLDSLGTCPRTRA